MNEQTKHPMVVFREQLTAPHQLDEFRAILPPGIKAEAFARVVATAVNEKPDLLHFDRRSLFNALMRAAKDGLLPDGKDGWILPYKENYQTQEGWKTRILARWTRSPHGEIKKIFAESRLRLDVKVVYPDDYFEYQEGDEPRIIHRPAPHDGRSEDIKAVYSIARDEQGRIISRDVMWKSEIDQIRSLAKSEKGPWSNPVFYPEMAKKTIIHHHCKSLPTSHQVDFEPIELGRVEPDRLRAPAEPAHELLPAPDYFPQAMPGEALHKPDRSVESVLDALAGTEPVGMVPPKSDPPKRHRRTKAEIEADRKAILEREAAEKEKYPGDTQPGRNPDREIVGASGGASGAPDPFVGQGGASGGGESRVVLLDDENKPYYQDTGEYLEETSDDHEHEEQEAKAHSGKQAVQSQAPAQSTGDAQVSQAPAGKSEATPKTNGGRQLNKDEQERYAYLREMTDSIKGRALSSKQEYLDFVERWLENAGDDGNRYQAVREFVGSTSAGKMFGVTGEDLRDVGNRVQAARKR